MAKRKSEFETPARKKAKSLKKGKALPQKSMMPTTLARAVKPFPAVFKTTLVYKTRGVVAQLGSPFSTFNMDWACNSLYDFDRTTAAFFENKQPAFYDKLMGADGPYAKYKVNSWKTYVEVINNSEYYPVTVFLKAAQTTPYNEDSLPEITDFPGSKRLILSRSGGSKSYGKLSCTGSTKDVNVSKDEDLTALYNADPALVIYGGLFFHNPHSLSGDPPSIDVTLTVTHYFDCELFEIDNSES